MYEKELKTINGGNYVLKHLSGWLAGGALTSVFTGQQINDFDVYFPSKEAFLDDLDYVISEEGWFVLDVTDRAVTMNSGNGYVTQFMCFEFFKDAQAIFDLFDYTINMGALHLKTQTFELHPSFLTDLAKRELNFNYKTRYPLASALRMHKYVGRGYNISKFELLKVITAVAMKEVTSWEELKAQLGGAYGEQIELKAEGEFNLENVMRTYTGEHILDRQKEHEYYTFESIQERIFGTVLKKSESEEIPF